MKTILTILILSSSLFANCEYYNDMFNQSKKKIELMQEFRSPYDIYNKEVKKALYYLENAERLCDNKEYYRVLIKFYEER